MNRPILYRGRIQEECSNAGQWIYGGAMEFRNKHYINGVVEVDSGVRLYVYVDPKTLGQYVCRIKNSNGEDVNIFEHDIIRLSRRDKKLSCELVVVYEKGRFILLHTDAEGCPAFDVNGYRLNAVSYLTGASGAVEVLGNIHDNPDMVSWSEESTRRYV
ncbi:MAG: hypothetical protein IJF84_13435 [Thermoguttaceae bacterium]|nr:hypothetical protein [Thermoguttaceae bacterium]